jgi:hypothetical protein
MKDGKSEQICMSRIAGSWARSEAKRESLVFQLRTESMDCVSAIVSQFIVS